MKRFLVSAIGVFASLIIALIIYSNFEHSSKREALFVLCFLSLASASIFITMKFIKPPIKEEKPLSKWDLWALSIRNCDYKYLGEGYGIAVDLAKQRLILRGDSTYKKVAVEYPFSDVREWGYEMPGYSPESITRVYGNPGVGVTAGAMAANIGTARRNKAKRTEAMENTGLWVKVKDIENPKWFVRFKSANLHDKDTEIELVRWMEILNQCINEGKRVRD